MPSDYRHWLSSSNSRARFEPVPYHNIGSALGSLAGTGVIPSVSHTSTCRNPARGRRHLVISSAARVPALARPTRAGGWPGPRRLGRGWEKERVVSRESRHFFVSRGRAVEGRERTMAARQRQNQRGRGYARDFHIRRGGARRCAARAVTCAPQRHARETPLPATTSPLTPKLTTVKTCTPRVRLVPLIIKVLLLKDSPRAWSPSEGVLCHCTQRYDVRRSLIQRFRHPHVPRHSYNPHPREHLDRSSPPHAPYRSLRATV